LKPNGYKKRYDARHNATRYWLKSSTMAVPLYESFAFKLTGPRQTNNGITFFPMELVEN